MTTRHALFISRRTHAKKNDSFQRDCNNLLSVLANGDADQVASLIDTISPKNIDAAADPLNYNDMDENGNPVGLNTTWTTSGTAISAGSFTVRLQHQPDEKTATSDANTGDTDFELTFVLNIQ